jgi:hypothetical protein
MKSSTVSSGPRAVGVELGSAVGSSLGEVVAEADGDGLAEADGLAESDGLGDSSLPTGGSIRPANCAPATTARTSTAAAARSLTWRLGPKVLGDLVVKAVRGVHARCLSDRWMSGPIASRSARRAWWSRDLAVPTGMSSASAISESERPR